MKSAQIKLSLKIIIMALFLTATLVISANASDADMTGIWNMDVTTPNGTGTPVFTLKQEGQKLSGTYKGKFGEAPVTGMVKGNTFEINYDSSGVPIKYSGTIDGNNVMGDVDFSSYGGGSFTGEKE